MSQPENPDTAADEPSDELAAKLFDYEEGTLAEGDRAEVEAYLRARGELAPPAPSLAALRNVPAPEAFTEAVAETIHKRSAGRFFARRTLGDRVPLGLLLVIALIVLLGVFVMIRRSPTGSLSVGHESAPAPAGSASDLAPTP